MGDSIQILTSTDTPQPSVSLNYILRGPMDLPLGNVTIMNFRPSILARHVRLYVGEVDVLKLSEVEVYGKWNSKYI